MHAHEIQNAVNAAEAVTSPIAPKDTPVTLTNETVLALIAAARRYQEAQDGIPVRFSHLD